MTRMGAAAAAATTTTSTSRRRRLRSPSVPAAAAAAAAAAADDDDDDDGAPVVLLGLRVVVADPSEAPPQLETDESYTLEVRRQATSPSLPPSSFIHVSSNPFLTPIPPDPRPLLSRGDGDVAGQHGVRGFARPRVVLAAGRLRLGAPPGPGGGCRCFLHAPPSPLASLPAAGGCSAPHRGSAALSLAGAAH